MTACRSHAIASPAIWHSTIQGNRIHHWTGKRLIRHITLCRNQSRSRRNQAENPLKKRLETVQANRTISKNALQDIKQALNVIRSKIERVDDDTKWAALELILGTSSSVVALTKKIDKPNTKIVKRELQQKKTKRHRTYRLHTYFSTASVIKSTRQKRKVLKTC